jgi:antitoxin PrlF
MPHIHQIATLTSKGQITLPKPIRQALGVDAGGRVAFDFNGQFTTVSKAAPIEHCDPAIAQFLTLLSRDIETGKNLSGLPDGLAQSLQQACKLTVDVATEIDGDVCL